MGADNLINFHKWHKWKSIEMKFGILEVKKSISVISIIKIGIDPMPTISNIVDDKLPNIIKYNFNICLLLKRVFKLL